MWGFDTWDNDRSADWFANLMEATDLPSRVMKTIEMTAVVDEDGYIDEPEILRSALYCVMCFCRVYCWPIDRLDSDLEIAITAIDKLINNEEYACTKVIADQLIKDKAELENRLHPK